MYVTTNISLNLCLGITVSDSTAGRRCSLTEQFKINGPDVLLYDKEVMTVEMAILSTKKLQVSEKCGTRVRSKETARVWSTALFPNSHISFELRKYLHPPVKIEIFFNTCDSFFKNFYFKASLHL